MLDFATHKLHSSIWRHYGYGLANLIPASTGEETKTDEPHGVATVEPPLTVAVEFPSVDLADQSQGQFHLGMSLGNHITCESPVSVTSPASNTKKRKLPTTTQRVVRRRINAANRLKIDEFTQLSSGDLRHQFNSANELVVSAASLRALPLHERAKRHACSKSVPRLFALPASWNIGISLSLGELWRRHRRLCELHRNYIIHQNDLAFEELASKRSKAPAPAIAVVDESMMEMSSREEIRLGASGSTSFVLGQNSLLAPGAASRSRSRIVADDTIQPQFVLDLF
ncbi:unnamed protein product [Protopolystoma xenopodis]|uniref:Uncharacterized protein n=1 Tax=Protopolystoma xenopodis TaxID=117903 RepID=A0A3S5FC11_9PLAT|nr:unnamed protein product [Protopolystoma xenopodis]